MRQTNVYIIRKERVWDGVLHVKRRIRRFWKTKATPTLVYQVSRLNNETEEESYLALKRRKLLVMRGRLKPGRLIYLVDLMSVISSPSSPGSSAGTTCCSILRRLLACHFFKQNFILSLKLDFMVAAHLAKRRSCNEWPDSVPLELPVTC